LMNYSAESWWVATGARRRLSCCQSRSLNETAPTATRALECCLIISIFAGLQIRFHATTHTHKGVSIRLLLNRACLHERRRVLVVCRPTRRHNGHECPRKDRLTVMFAVCRRRAIMTGGFVDAIHFEQITIGDCVVGRRVRRNVRWTRWCVD
jgi:hypothetical protein